MDLDFCNNNGSNAYTVLGKVLLDAQNSVDMVSKSALTGKFALVAHRWYCADLI
jgi:hypothetical protein